MKSLTFLVALLCIFFISCSKEEANDAEITIREVTLSIEVPSSGGAIFHGNHELENIESAGFYISTKQSFNIEEAQSLIATSATHFKAEIESGLEYNVKYYVRAFVNKSNGDYVESKEKSFVSLGSKAPIISSMSDSHLNDVVTIKGKNFKNSNYNALKVFFESEKASIINSNDTIIECLVPVNIPSHTPQVRLMVYEKEVIYDDFSLFTPDISATSQQDFALGDTITLYGDHFDTAIDRTKIVSDQSELEILFTDRDSIIFVLPLDATSSNLDLTLKAQKQEVDIDFLGKYREPVITEIDGNIRTWDTLIIKGENFSPLIDANEVYFDGLKAQILSSTHSEIKVITPLGPYQDAEPELVYKIMDYEIRPSFSISFVDSWLFKAETEYEFYGNTDQYFTKDGKLYLVQKNYGEYYLSFLEFDPASLEFNSFELILPDAKLADFPFQIIQNQTSKKIYFLFNAGSENFYEFDLSTESFKPLKDYPAITTNNPEVFMANDMIYVTGGWVDTYSSIENTDEKIKELWAYNISNNNWIQKNDFPRSHGGYGDVIFQKENEIYIVYGINTSGGVNFWEYSTNTDNWKDLNSHPSAKFGKASFVHNGSGYAYFSDPINATPDNFAHKYTFETNSWVPIEPLNNRYYTYFNFPNNYAAFKVDERMFIVIDEYPALRFFEADLNKI